MRVFMLLLVLAGCKLSNSEWFVESWDDPTPGFPGQAVIRHQGDIYKATCLASYVIVYDPSNPETPVSQEEHPCGVMREYVGRSIPRLPDADGWVIRMFIADEERMLQLQKNVPFNEHGLDMTKRYRESYTILSVAHQQQ